MKANLFKPQPHHRVRKYVDWLKPPQHCDVCGGPAVMVSNALIHGRPLGDWCWIHYCTCCEAYVGCHPGSIYPLGKMADAATRRARSEVHSLLDPVWKAGSMTRKQAYAWLSELLGMPPWETAHVGHMDLEECQQAAELLRDALIAEDFG